jgi:hypothetical protein
MFAYSLRTDKPTCPELGVPMISFWSIKIGKKCKHLSNFPEVTLQALCYL